MQYADHEVGLNVAEEFKAVQESFNTAVRELLTCGFVLPCLSAVGLLCLTADA